ncbi:sulfotransferase family protein [Paraglaciecola marina]|uniref:sulfotransferase family protein n=1 Tax=Paraglaciecola marina TaxID=2500157 RepID=UPI0010622AE2|nr:sulfotransferase [Paraglaciecola marina]
MIFLTGYPRSGTTLLANKLNSIESVYVGPETQFYRNIYHQLAGLDKPDFFQVVSNDKRLKDYNLKANEIQLICEESKYDRDNFLSVFLSYVGKQKNCPVVIEKTPAHILYWEKIFECHPNAKIIYLVKDVRDVVLSNLKVDWTHSNSYLHAAEWTVYNEQYQKLTKKNSSRVMVVKFEDFIASPLEQNKRVCDFLGIANSLKTEQSANAVPDWELQWKADSMKAIDTSKLYAWKLKGDNEVVSVANYVAKSSIKALGYEALVSRLPFFQKLKGLFYKGKLVRKYLMFKRVKV